MTSEGNIVEVKNLSKIFRLPHEKYSTAKQHFVNIFNQGDYEEFKALENVSFEIKKGEFFGIIGSNGSGKSTLLKTLAGIYQPTSGEVKIKGSLSPFIELGVGFNPELTARDNVFLNAAILGLTKKQTEDKYDEIVSFSELANFMDQKLKNFSSGMQVRLAFSIAIHAQSDILLIDEVLAVGDTAFQEKCFAVFRDLKRHERSVIFVSHDLNTVQQFCDKVALLSKGKLISIDKPRRVINDYISLVDDQEVKDLLLNDLERTKKRWGDGGAKIIEGWIEDGKGERKNIVSQEFIKIRLKVEFFKDVVDPIFGIILRNDNGVSVLESNTQWLGMQTGRFKKGQRNLISWELENNLDSGRYTITPAVAYTNGLKFFDWVEDYLTFIVKKKYKTGGVVNQPHRISVE